MTIVSQGSDRFIPATVQFNSQCRLPDSMNILQRQRKSCPTPPQHPSAWIASWWNNYFAKVAVQK